MGSHSSAAMQSVYSTAPGDWAVLKGKDLDNGR